jgi:hypothetical protein
VSRPGRAGHLLPTNVRDTSCTRRAHTWPCPSPRPGTTGDHPPGGPGRRPIGVTVGASARHRITPREGAVPWAARNSARWRPSGGPTGCPRSTERSRTWPRLRVGAEQDVRAGLRDPGAGAHHGVAGGAAEDVGAMKGPRTARLATPGPRRCCALRTPASGHRGACNPPRPGLLARGPATAGGRPDVLGGRDRLMGWDLGGAVSQGFLRLAVDEAGRAAVGAGR